MQSTTTPILIFPSLHSSTAGTSRRCFAGPADSGRRAPGLPRRPALSRPAPVASPLAPPQSPALPHLFGQHTASQGRTAVCSTSSRETSCSTSYPTASATSHLPTSSARPARRRTIAAAGKDAPGDGGKGGGGGGAGSSKGKSSSGGGSGGGAKKPGKGSGDDKADPNKADFSAYWSLRFRQFFSGRRQYLELTRKRQEPPEAEMKLDAQIADQSRRLEEATQDIRWVVD
jgi:hypothetical protein